MKIKANHLTITRILFLPIPCYLLFQDRIYQIIALFLLVALGITDWFDGWLARRDGPTVLGSLLDPIADKIFVAFAYITITRMDIIPWWATFLIFFREFVITVLRSLSARSKIVFKTSKLAKYKTAIQIGACGFMLWLIVMDNHKFLMMLLLIVLALLSLIPPIIIKFVQHKSVSDKIIAFPAFFSLVPVLLYFIGIKNTIWFGIILVLFITYLSGIQYVWNLLLSIKQATAGKSLNRFIVTMFEGILLPLGIVYISTQPNVNVWIPMAIITIELSIGGLDNLLAAIGKFRSIPWIWGRSALLLIVETFMILRYYNLVNMLSLNIFMICTLLIVLIYGVAEFYKHRDDYIKNS